MMVHMTENHTAARTRRKALAGFAALLFIKEAARRLRNSGVGDTDTRALGVEDRMLENDGPGMTGDAAGGVARTLLVVDSRPALAVTVTVVV